MRIHLLPASNKASQKHYADTVLNHSKNCKSNIIAKYVNKEISNTLKQNSYALWGVTNGGRNINKGKWEKMQPRDIALFYKDKKFFSAGHICEKFHSQKFAQQLWGHKYNENLDAHETWENMFLINNIKDIEISIDSFNKLFGLRGPLYQYKVLDEIESENFLEIFDSINIPDNEDSVSRKKHSSDKGIKVKMVNYKKGTVSKSVIVRTEKETIIKQKEMELVDSFVQYLKKNNLGTFKKLQIYINEDDEKKDFETDGWIVESSTLIEAKSSKPVSRPDVRMAIGQLHDYKRHHKPKPKNLAILLPALPTNDLVDLIFSQNINIIYKSNNEFIFMNKP